MFSMTMADVKDHLLIDQQPLLDGIERKDKGRWTDDCAFGEHMYRITSLSHHHIVYKVFNTIYSLNDPMWDT